MKRTDPENRNYQSQLTIWRDGIEIKGSITSLDKYSIEVEIEEPFFNWRKQLYISGPAKLNPNNFQHRSQEVGEKLLGEMYSTLKELDDSIDRFSKLFISLENEKEALKSIEDEEIRLTISSKLEDWFYGNFSNISFSQKERIENVMSIYIDTGIKIYK